MNILKQKIMIMALLLFMSVYAYGQEFKVDGVKYMGNDDGTAVLIDYKKAAGKLEIPSTVTGKKGQIYTVTAIGRNAFENSQLTEVVIPNTVKELGKFAFQGSTLLEKVTLSTEIKHIPTYAFYGCRSLGECSLEHVETIGEGAFSWANFESLVIPANVTKIDKEAFSKTKKLSNVTILPAPTALVVSEHAFDGALIKTLFIDREILPPNNATLQQLYPFDYKETLKELTIGEHVMSVPKTLVSGCMVLEKVILMEKKLKADNLEEMFRQLPPTTYDIKIPGTRVRSWGGDGNHQHHYQQLSVEIQGETKIFTPGEAIAYFADLEELEAFKKYMTKFINVASKFPEGLENVYASMDVKQIKKFPDVYIDAINYVCDSIYLPKTEFSAAELDVLTYLCNSQIHAIGLDNNRLWPSRPIRYWFADDMLNKDSKAEQHKEAYERILAMSEAAIRAKSALGAFNMLQQLIALCGLGRWKESQQYFPKVHRAITENGKYLVPPEVKYIQSELTKRGYPPTTPKY